jgi:phage-related protein
MSYGYEKPLFWVASSKRDLVSMPAEVQDTFGFALSLAQHGSKHPDTKPLKGFGHAGVLEVVEDFHGNTYRAVYTVRFGDAVYVLHCFQKKSPKSIQTPLHDIALIKTRFVAAENHWNGLRDD